MDLFSTFPSAPLSYGTYAVLGLMLALFALCLWGYARSSRLSKAEPKPNSRPEENRLANWIGLRDVTPWMKAALTLVMGIFGVLFILALIAITLILIETIFPFVTNEATAVSLGLGTMFVALLGAPFVIWRSVVAQKTLDATMHGQVTDRINKAVEGLGAEKIIKNSGEDVSVPNMEVRIGSILALERIAKENLDFHIQVMEILCAYVRENSHLRPTQLSPHERLSTANPSQAGYTTKEAAERIKRTLEIDQDTWEWKNELQCSNDIQAAITALGRRSTAQISVEKSSEPRFVFDLRKTTLKGADFSSLDLGGFDLQGADLRGSIFKKTRAKSTDFRKCKIMFCEFQKTELGYAKKFSDADLSWSSFRETDLSRIDMEKERFNQIFGDASNSLPPLANRFPWIRVWQERGEIHPRVFHKRWHDWYSDERTTS